MGEGQHTEPPQAHRAEKETQEEEEKASAEEAVTEGPAHKLPRKQEPHIADVSRLGAALTDAAVDGTLAGLLDDTVQAAQEREAMNAGDVELQLGTATARGDTTFVRSVTEDGW